MWPASALGTDTQGNWVCLRRGVGVYTLDALGTAIWSDEAEWAYHYNTGRRCAVIEQPQNRPSYNPDGTRWRTPTAFKTWLIRH